MSENKISFMNNDKTICFLLAPESYKIYTTKISITWTDSIIVIDYYFFLNIEIYTKSDPKSCSQLSRPNKSP